MWEPMRDFYVLLIGVGLVVLWMIIVTALAPRTVPRKTSAYRRSSTGTTGHSHSGPGPGNGPDCDSSDDGGCDGGSD